MDIIELCFFCSGQAEGTLTVWDESLESEIPLPACEECALKQDWSQVND